MTGEGRDSAQEDLGLLQRVSAGDREALRQLYQKYFARLSRFLSRVTDQRSVIEELINDTMLVVWLRAGEFRGDSRPSTWIFGIAYRRALKTLKRSARAARQLAVVSEVGPDTEVSPDPLSARAETEDWLRRALERLSAEHRLTIELAYFMGMSCEEIAEVTDCPAATVKTRLFYARRHLREILLTLATPSTRAQLRASAFQK